MGKKLEVNKKQDIDSKKILLVYTPFCTPVTPPYSLINIKGFLDANLDKSYDVEIFDSNIYYHNKKFSNYKKIFKNLDNISFEEYENKTKSFLRLTKKDYSINNRRVIKGEIPDLVEEIYDKILAKKPKVVAFSVVYSSQAFYTYYLIHKLKKAGIKTVVGGPAVNNKLIESSKFLHNEIDLLNFIIGFEKKNLVYDFLLDYSIFDDKAYFTKDIVMSVKSSSSCYYKQCAFCTHHQNIPYFEFPIENIVKSIKLSGKKFVFFIDDMIHKKRLLEISKALKPLNVKWMAQLKPTKDLSKDVLKELYESGLRLVLWGVESFDDDILKLMRKGTNKNDLTKVIKDSHYLGIKNTLYIMFGFPGEKKENFDNTINSLKDYSEYIDLVSASIFGLQKGSFVFNNPDKFHITSIKAQKRTLLDESFSYEIEKEYLSTKDATKLKKNFKKTLEGINSYPKSMNFFREHLLQID